MAKAHSSTFGQHDLIGRAHSETTSIDVAAMRLGIGRTLAYQLARRGEFPVPVIRAGRRFVVPIAALDRALGIVELPLDLAA
jgi:hypothetical protein